MKDKSNILAYFAKEAWRHKKHVVSIFVLVPTTIILERYIAPLLIAYVLFHIQASDITLAGSWWVLVVYFAIETYSQVVAYRLIMWLMWGVQVRGAGHLYKVAYDKLSRNSLAFYSDTFTGSLVSQVNRFTGAFMEFCNTITFQVIFIVTAIIASIIGLSLFLWQYALILLGLTIIFVTVVFIGTRFMRPLFKARNDSYTEISGKLSDSISNMLAVKTDAREAHERKLLSVSTDNMIEKELAARGGMVRVTSIYAFIVGVMKLGALAASIWSIQSGVGSAAVIYLAITYTFNLIDELWHVTGLLRSYYQITGDSAATLLMLQQPSSVKDRTKIKLGIKKPSIEFHNIFFSHVDKQVENEETIEPTPLFREFSLHIDANEKIGLVGVSGSGKSTLLKLLMRFYDVDSGKITIDGHDIARVTQQSLHENIAYVPQEPLLFHRSILENIAYSKPDATTEDVYKAAEQANALEFIEKLPNGFDTLVGERGVKLSGGQRQRVAIARAILKNAPILILDEATSALDSESEVLIQGALRKLMKGRTSIVIAHRLSTIANLDRVVVLHEGNIVEDGTHAELLAAGETYAKLWAHQSGGFIEE